jgi:hypothetical protein
VEGEDGLNRLSEESGVRLCFISCLCSAAMAAQSTMAEMAGRRPYKVIDKAEFGTSKLLIYMHK